MKDQYFGDVNDYRKYGLLRCIASSGMRSILVVWMLTPDDGGSDGQKISYLLNSVKWAGYDPALFKGLKDTLDSNDGRRVSLMEGAGLLPHTDYFSEIVPDSATLRNLWFQDLLECSGNHDLVFLDPDNGFEVKSKPYGRKFSGKYVFWKEVELLWRAGRSLLIYQHFNREKRSDFIQRLLSHLEKNAPGARLEAFITPHVVFFMVLQPRHHELYSVIVDSVQRSWAGQILSFSNLPEE